jgi:cell division control protein CDC15
MSEIKVQRGLTHPQICRLYHFFDDEYNIYIILELCVLGTLEDLLKTRRILHELEVQFYAFQMMKALQYMR